MKIITLLLALLISTQAQAGPRKAMKKVFVTAVEHVTLGAGTEIAVSQIAGGPSKYPAGLVAAGLVAGFKEGADAVSGADTKKRAALHALTIVAGAGVMAAARH